jgi:hypothetical protein
MPKGGERREPFLVALEDPLIPTGDVCTVAVQPERMMGVKAAGLRNDEHMSWRFLDGFVDDLPIGCMVVGRVSDTASRPTIDKRLARSGPTEQGPNEGLPLEKLPIGKSIRSYGSGASRADGALRGGQFQVGC